MFSFFFLCSSPYIIIRCSPILMHTVLSVFMHVPPVPTPILMLCCRTPHDHPSLRTAPVFSSKLSYIFPVDTTDSLSRFVLALQSHSYGASLYQQTGSVDSQFSVNAPVRTTIVISSRDYIALLRPCALPSPTLVLTWVPRLCLPPHPTVKQPASRGGSVDFQSIPTQFK